jgi:hypothetical protein
MQVDGHLTMPHPSYADDRKWENTSPSNEVSSHMIELLSKNHMLLGKMICNQDDYANGDETHADAARYAFAQMGLYYFPPQISKTSEHTLELSCGGAHKTTFFQYGGGWLMDNRCTSSTSYEGQLTSGSARTVAQYKLDGGQVNGDNTGWNGDNNDHTVRSHHTDAMEYWENPVDVGSLGQKCVPKQGGRQALLHHPTYRPRNGGSTYSCCAPHGREMHLTPSAGIHYSVNASGIGYCPNPDTGNSGLSGLPDQLTCYRAAYGNNGNTGSLPGASDRTAECRSEVRLRITTCKLCNCPELVRIDIDHGLKAPSGGGTCKPWFVQADAGVRGWIAYWRAQINTEKAATCS